MRRIKPHTIEKLAYFKKYIEAYLVVTKRLPMKYYVDAFAGSGKCILCGEKCESSGGPRCSKCGKGKLVDGSAMISLNTKTLFDGYIFIDLNKTCIVELRDFISKIDPNLQKKISVKDGDANILLKDIYKYISKFTGCLIFLDPEGPELEWETIIYLSKIPKIDLLILYPYDMALVRLTRKYPQKLDKFYGDKNWRKIYYDSRNFTAPKRKNALLKFYLENLKKLGFEFVDYKQIRRKLREGKPLYHLILASHRAVAVKIMDSIFNKELDGQQKIKLSC